MAEEVAGITTMTACNNQVEHTKNVCPLQNVSCSPSVRGISDSEVNGGTQPFPGSEGLIRESLSSLHMRGDTATQPAGAIQTAL